MHCLRLRLYLCLRQCLRHHRCHCQCQLPFRLKALRPSGKCFLHRELSGRVFSAESRCCDDTPEQGGTVDGKEEKPFGDGAESRCCDDTPEKGGTADGKEEKPFGEGAERRLDSAIRADLVVTRCQTDVCFCPFFVHAPEFFPRDLLVNVSTQNSVSVFVFCVFLFLLLACLLAFLLACLRLSALKRCSKHIFGLADQGLGARCSRVLGGLLACLPACLLFFGPTPRQTKTDGKGIRQKTVRKVNRKQAVFKNSA